MRGEERRRERGLIGDRGERTKRVRDRGERAIEAKEERSCRER